METNDRLSELPICLLVSILSLLSAKDAVKTSILSRRWRHLFMLSPDVVVDCANIFSDDQDHRRFDPFTHSSYDDFRKERQEFIRRVDQFIQGRHKRSLTVRFFMENECSPHLDRWLEVAVASGLTKLELFLSLEQNFVTPLVVEKRQLYNFPYRLFSETNTSVLSHLRLEKCVMRVPGSFTGFRNLRCLELDNVILAEDFATKILPGCLLLEQVTFLFCRISTLCFDHPFLPLKHLKVLHCYSEPIIKITSMNLTTFEYDGGMINIAHLYAPQLKEMCSLDYFSERLSLAHFSRLPKLEILCLLYINYRLVREEIPRSLASLTNLKQLSLFLISGADDF